jgi:hypothetical protein
MSGSDSAAESAPGDSASSGWVTDDMADTDDEQTDSQATAVSEAVLTSFAIPPAHWRMHKQPYCNGLPPLGCTHTADVACTGALPPQLFMCSVQAAALLHAACSRQYTAP